MNDESCEIDRRKLLARCIGGGAGALAATMFTGSSSLAQNQQARPAPSVRPQVTSDRIRRVLTGTNAQGQSVIVSDELAPVAEIWRTSHEQPLGAAAAQESTQLLPTTVSQIDPMPGGSRFFIASIGPSAQPKPTRENRQGFHRTATVDYIFVLSGEITLLTDLQEVKLNTGDCTILRNISHSWRNDLDRPCQLLVAMVRVDR